MKFYTSLYDIYVDGVKVVSLSFVNVLTIWLGLFYLKSVLPNYRTHITADWLFLIISVYYEIVQTSTLSIIILIESEVKMRKKSLSTMTYTEAEALVEEVVGSSKSEDEIRHRLTDAGFNARKIRIRSRGSGSRFEAMVLTWGPRGEAISV